MDKETYTDWLRYYRRAHSIKSPASYSKKKKEKIPKEEFEDFIQEVTAITKASSRYLNSKGHYMAKPLWVYDEDDETTWASSPKFAYRHLLSS